MGKYLFVLCFAIVLLTGCANEVVPESQPEKVVALGSSLADVWLSAGGELIGVTSDVFGDRDLGIDEESVSVVGTIKDPNIEAILSLQPDLVLLTSDISGHIEIAPILAKSQIPYYVANVDGFEDYLVLLKEFTDMTGRQDLYVSNGLEVEKKIEKLIKDVPVETAPKVLFLRASSSNVKSIGADHFVSEMLRNLNAVNIAEKNDAILEELTLEAIIAEDPDYIFVAIMGTDTEAAMAALEESVMSNPAWSSLSAVKNDQFIVLPKELFHYKPNVRWGDAYEYLYEVLYSESDKA